LVASSAATLDPAPPWARKIRVMENSPNLCPTISSVTKTLMNVLPLWTLKVWPTKSGTMVDARDHVLIGSREPLAFCFCTFASNLGSTNGPFLVERLTVSSSCGRGR